MLLLSVVWIIKPYRDKIQEVHILRTASKNIIHKTSVLQSSLFATADRHFNQRCWVFYDKTLNRPVIDFESVFSFEKKTGRKNDRQLGMKIGRVFS